VRGRVELAEHVGVRVALDGDPQRGRPARPREPERLHLFHDEAELIVERLDDGLAARSRHVQVRRPASSVPHREDIVRSEQAEGGQREGDPQDDPGEDVGRMVLREVQPGQPGEQEHHADRPLAERAWPAGGHERVDGTDQESAQQGHREGRHREAGPRADDLHPVGAWPLQQAGHPARDHDDDHVHAHPDEQVPPPADDHQDDQIGDPQPLQGPWCRRKAENMRYSGQPGCAEVGDRLQHRGVRHVDEGHPARRDHDDPRQHDECAEPQPPLAGGVQMAGQGRRLTGGTAAPAHALDRGRSRTRGRDGGPRAGRRLRQRCHTG
jgi:hypothetical protein